jgi:hypothetical protein
VRVAVLDALALAPDTEQAGEQGADMPEVLQREFRARGVTPTAGSTAGDDMNLAPSQSGPSARRPVTRSAR